jgi:hypothetical protein
MDGGSYWAALFPALFLLSETMWGGGGRGGGEYFSLPTTERGKRNRGRVRLDWEGPGTRPFMKGDISFCLCSILPTDFL